MAVRDNLGSNKLGTNNLKLIVKIQKLQKVLFENYNNDSFNEKIKNWEIKVNERTEQ